MRIVVGEGKRWDERNVDRWIWVGSPRFQMENWMEEFKGDWVPAASSVAVMHGSEFRGEKKHSFDRKIHGHYLWHEVLSFGAFWKTWLWHNKWLNKWGMKRTTTLVMFSLLVIHFGTQFWAIPGSLEATSKGGGPKTTLRWKWLLSWRALAGI